MSDSIPPGVMPVFISDAARRASDIINTLRTTHDWDELKHSWIAIRLSDGGSDGVLYPSKPEAARHQLHEFQCWYVAFRNLMGGSNPGECERLLDFYRKAYAAGFRMVDPDDVNGGPEILPTAARMDDFNNRMFPVLNRAARRAHLKGHRR